MKIFRGMPPADQRPPCALTIGNFDGVHRGHQALLAQVRAAASARGLLSCVLTFAPHPKEFFEPASAPTRVSTLRDRIDGLREAGIDRVVIARFNARFAVQSPDEFIRDVLRQGLNVRWIMVGDDFRFGARRAGNFDYLREAGWQHGFEVHHFDTIADAGVRVSSSAVRAALGAGDLGRAQQLLGRPYRISGHVLHGEKLGRALGFPTLNLALTDRRRVRQAPLAGIFVVAVHGLADGPLPGVASVGARPTVDDSGRMLLEVHLFDFAQTVYGKLVRVDFLHKLRDQEKYDSLDALQAAIAQDAAHARAYFAGAVPPTI